LSGRQYFINNELAFPPTPNAKGDGFYRTVFGGFSLSSIVYARSNQGMNLALRRLTAVRFLDGRPGDPYSVRSVTHKRMFMEQRTFFVNHAGFFLKLRKQMEPHFEGYTDMDTELRQHHADPHPKVKGRIHAYHQLNATGERYSPYYGLRAVKYKQKGEEQAKPGKKPRGIGDMQIPASLQGFRLMGFFKTALSDEIEYLGGIMQFVKAPTPALMTHVFDNLINLRYRYFIAIFSDDSVLAYRDMHGNIITANLDISSCDASHGPSVFDAFVDVFPARIRDDALQLVGQCRQPFVVTDVNDYKRRVTFRSNVPLLFSGSTITTGINTLAVCAIAASIAESIDSGLPPTELITSAAERAGYRVTVEICHDYAQIQFLKHSPAYCTRGVLRSVINLGVFLRSAWQCCGDLPGRGPLRARGRSFQRELLQGMFPHLRTPLVDAMKLRLSDAAPSAASRRMVSGQLLYKVSADGESFSLTTAEQFRRYSTVGTCPHMDQGEIDRLVYAMSLMDYGDHYADSGVAKIAMRDYGLDCRYGYPAHFVRK
jgi:hypothetical protein